VLRYFSLLLTRGQGIGRGAPTYLSILELLIVLLMLCGLREGVRIEFWTRLMRGTTIGEIHDAYEARGLWSAIRGVCRLRWNRVGVATIETAVSMARGPMFSGRCL
jgi:hypothetical protein